MPKGQASLLLTLRSMARTNAEKRYACGLDPWDDSDTCKRLQRKLEKRGIKTAIEKSDVVLTR